MLKVNLLREMIVKCAAQFKQDPKGLEVYTTRGTIQSTGVPAIGWSTEYEINVFVTDFAGELNHLILAILLWAQQYQPDLLFNEDKQKNGIRFDADILDNDTIDALFTIKANEYTYTRFDDGNVVFNTPLEPDEPVRQLPEWTARVESGVITYA